MRLVRARLLLRLLTSVTLFGAATAAAQGYPKDSRPQLFSYDELVLLGSDQPLSPALADKLHRLTTTPFINNEAYLRGARPRPLDVPDLGPTLRVAFWNIERGLELDDIQLLLTDSDRFMARVKEEREHARKGGKRVRQVMLEMLPQQIETLRAADVWILNEVDWGVKRTGYREIVRELAETLNMNWAYGVEFLEVDAKQLGIETFEMVEEKPARLQLLEEFKVDKERLRALHGNAVLSRYPIRSARLVPFTVGYNWFSESRIRSLEKGKRKAAILIGEELLREVRRGQRTTLLVELDVPTVPGHVVTVAATHLENRAKPSVRRQQMAELLKEIHAVSTPVIVAGDLNTTGSDGTPTSVERMLYKRYGSLDFWATKGIQWTTGVGLVYTSAKAIRSLARIQYRVDPTSANIPGASPNLERGLFDTIERFRFADGDVFDFRGVPPRTVNGTAGTLSNSNQRRRGGFEPTFIAELIWGSVRVARFKLDWMLVKADLTHPRDRSGPYRLAPHFARTLSDLNNCLPEPISDHSPMTVDLPLQEPTVPQQKASR